MKIRMLFAVGLACAALMCVRPVFAGEECAWDQLQNMNNSGKTFDGSDGNRSGMDINYIRTPAPSLPEPTAEPVE